MLNDSDPWPIPCPYCGEILQKHIGTLKHTVSITCVCGREFGFNKETFSQGLEQLKKSR